MKKEYPRYEHGALDIAETKLCKEDKEVLANFLKKCSITAGEKKVLHIKKLLIQLWDVTQIPLTKQTKDSIDSYLSLLSNSDKSYWTKDELRVYIKQFLLWHYKDFTMVENIRSESQRGLNTQKVTENNLITEKDVENMLRFAKSYKDSCYLLLAFQTGARPQELLNLKWKDVKFEDKYADITLFSGKTEETRTFPIVDKTMKALWDWKQHYAYADVSPKDFVFVSRKRNKAMTTAGLNKMLRNMAKDSKIGKDVWTYLLRHTRATRLYEELPQQIVEKLMGHKNMAGVYAHISSKKAREEMLNKIYKIDELTPSKKTELEERIQKLGDLSKIQSNIILLQIKKLKGEITENEYTRTLQSLYSSINVLEEKVFTK
jgi:integrase